MAEQFDKKDLIPFNELGTHLTDKQTREDFLNKEFTNVLENGKPIVACRNDWEQAMGDMRTSILTDGAMQKIINIVKSELDTNYDFSDRDDSYFDEKFWYEYEQATALFAPYYEDLKTPPTIGARVFDLANYVYGVVTEILSDCKVRLDNGHVTRYQWVVAEY